MFGKIRPWPSQQSDVWRSCGAPLLQLNTVQSFDIFSLRKLIAQIPKMDKQIESAFKG